MYLSNVNNIRHKSFYFAGKQQQKTTIKCKNSDLLILCNVKQTLILRLPRDFWVCRKELLENTTQFRKIGIFNIYRQFKIMKYSMLKTAEFYYRHVRDAIMRLCMPPTLSFFFLVIKHTKPTLSSPSMTRFNLNTCIVAYDQIFLNNQLKFVG